MASINEKLNYINETKSLIKDKLNDLGSEIEDETTFREYADKIEGLYNEWPKINDEDTTVTLNNTKKGKINLQLKGNLNQFTTTGKNLFNKTTSGVTIVGTSISELETGKRATLTQNGTYKYSAVPFAKNYLLGQSIKIYAIIAPSASNIGRIGIAQLSSSNQIIGSVIGSISTSGFSSVIDLPSSYSEGATHFGLILYGNVNGTGNINDYVDYTNLMIVPSSITDINYEPYTGGIASPNPDYPQDIQIVTGENNVIINNTNFFDINSNPLENRSSTRVGTTGYISLKKGTYTLSYEGADKSYYIYYDKNNVKIGESNWVTGNATFNLADDYKLILIFAKQNDTNISMNDVSNIMLVKDSTAPSTYVAHQEQTYPLSFGNMEFAKVTNYVDVISGTINNWKKVKYVEKINSYNGETITTDYICTTGGLNTGATVYYGLNTAVDIPITDTTLVNQLNALKQVMSYDNQTNISQENDNLPFIINATALMKNSD